MNTESWQDDNNRYLAASLQWLRLRLQRKAPDEGPVAAEDIYQTTKSSGSTSDKTLGPIRGWSPMESLAAKAAHVTEEGKTVPLDVQIKEAEAVRNTAADVDPPPALILLAQRLGLSAFERDILFQCVAVEFDPGLSSLYARTQGNVARNYPTFALALSVLDDPVWEALSPHRPLRYVRLIEMNQPGATPLTSCPLRADERMVNFVKGLNVLDDRLATLMQAVDSTGESALAQSQQAVVETVLQRLREAAEESVVPAIQLVGADSSSKLAVARQVCVTLNRRLYRIGMDALPPQVSEIETLARLWQRETFLLPVALYIDADDMEGVSGETKAALHRFLSHPVGLVFLGVREVPARLSAVSVSVEVKKPTAAEQFEVWTSVIKAHEAESEISQAAGLLAGQFNLNLSDIRQVASLAMKGSAKQGTMSQQLWDSCCELTRPRLDALAQRLDVKATWEDLVLPAEQMALMRQIVAHVRGRHTVYGEWGFALKMNRGFGVSALFAGESGTGKTMAAEVIANDLRLNLYRIDLSAVVSKYIGETEKNLRKLFDAAEQGGAILFFDEADALFGKRSEVKDSHDRYANIEINYLLQRMESFSGLAILASNMKSALDPAFMRRLRFIVNFPFPGPKERRLIWEKALPVQTPKEEVDYDRLGRVNITGGNIHSIALNAAFLAAEKGKPITMPILLSAARAELRKLEKPFSEAELR